MDFGWVLGRSAQNPLTLGSTKMDRFIFVPYYNPYVCVLYPSLQVLSVIAVHL